ncbi:hypothetical protein GOM49_06650 [Clostridium bovifaecis]|uniref:Uncharacterized protein n=1 Tax=Clostridium bovifaecis TaxID=2184719 RepID=A0A6I6ERK9_9CLOT|nr:hypothetical protein GOM49_06650 [Clostridium bovifaecis]
MKKLTKSILTLILTLSLFTSLALVAYAEDVNSDVYYNEIVVMVNDANSTIQNKIDEAVRQADMLTLAYNKALAAIEGTGNYQDKSSAINQAYNYGLDAIEDKLIKETNEISDKVIEEAGEKGVIVQCELVPVQLGDRVVMVDPLIIING